MIVQTFREFGDALAVGWGNTGKLVIAVRIGGQSVEIHTQFRVGQRF